MACATPDVFAQRIYHVANCDTRNVDGTGIRLYSTVLAVKLGIRFGFLKIAEQLSHLQLLATTPILVLSRVVYPAEFIADKISWFDSSWDAIHTFIQPLGAAIVGATAMSVVDPVYVKFDFPLHARLGVIAPDDQAQAGARRVDNAHDARSTASRMLMLRASRFQDQ